MKMMFLAMGLINLLGMAVVLFETENAKVEKNQDNNEVTLNNFAVGLRKAS